MNFNSKKNSKMLAKYQVFLMKMATDKQTNKQSCINQQAKLNYEHPFGHP
jgi:hypothetical protein